MLSLQSGRPCGTPVSKSPNNVAQLPIARGTVWNVYYVDVDRKGVNKYVEEDNVVLIIIKRTYYDYHILNQIVPLYRGNLNLHSLNLANNLTAQLGYHHRVCKSTMFGSLSLIWVRKLGYARRLGSIKHLYYLTDGTIIAGGIKNIAEREKSHMALFKSICHPVDSDVSLFPHVPLT